MTLDESVNLALNRRTYPPFRNLRTRDTMTLRKRHFGTYLQGKSWNISAVPNMKNA